MNGNKKFNVYDLSQDFGIGYTDNGIIFYFDLDDYNLIKNYYWNIHNGYMSSRDFHNGKSKRIYMHRLILQNIMGNKFIVDHENHNKVDNRKSNIRPVTYSENNFNTKLNVKNKSGVIGVYYNKIDKVWEARLQKNKKMIFIERHETMEDAIVARLKAEKKYFGEFAPQKELFETYNI